MAGLQLSQRLTQSLVLAVKKYKNMKRQREKIKRCCWEESEEGRANKQIASELCISIKTVEKHRQQVMNKLNIHDVAGLTRYAISKGLIDRGIPAGVVN